MVVGIDWIRLFHCLLFHLLHSYSFLHDSVLTLQVLLLLLRHTFLHVGGLAALLTILLLLFVHEFLKR